MHKSSEEKARKLLALGFTEERISELLSSGHAGERFMDSPVASGEGAPPLEARQPVADQPPPSGEGDFTTAPGDWQPDIDSRTGWVLNIALPCVKGEGLCALRTRPGVRFQCIFDSVDCAFRG